MSPQVGMSEGPPPPEMRPGEDSPEGKSPEDRPEGMPSSMVPAGKDKEGSPNAGPSGAVAQAQQALQKFGQSLQELAQIFQALDVQAGPILEPALQAGKAIDQRLKQLQQRIQRPQPSMANMDPRAQQGGQQGQAQPPAGAM